jgi:hypothetical protein
MPLTSVMLANVIGLAQQQSDKFEHIGTLPSPMKFGKLLPGQDVIEVFNTETSRKGLFKISDKTGLQPIYKEVYLLTPDLALTKGGADPEDGWTLHVEDGEVESTTTETDATKVYSKVNDDAYIFRTADKVYSVFDGKGAKIFGDYERLRPFGKNAVSVVKDGRLGVLNLEEEEVLPFEYVSLTLLVSKGMCIVANADNKFGLIKLDKTVVIPVQFNNMVLLRNGNVAAFDESGQAAIYSTSGEVIVESRARSFSQSTNNYMGWTLPDGSDSGILDIETGKDVYKGGGQFDIIYQLKDEFFIGRTREVFTVSYNSAIKYKKLGLINVKTGAMTPVMYYTIELETTPEGPVFKLSDIEKRLSHIWLMNKNGKMIAKQVDADFQEVNGRSMITWKGVDSSSNSDDVLRWQPPLWRKEVPQGAQIQRRHRICQRIHHRRRQKGIR